MRRALARQGEVLIELQRAQAGRTELSEQLAKAKAAAKERGSLLRRQTDLQAFQEGQRRKLMEEVQSSQQRCESKGLFSNRPSRMSGFKRTN